MVNKINSEPDFYKTYCINDNKVFLLEGSAFKIFSYLCRLMDYKNIVLLDSIIRKDLEEICNIKRQTVYNSLTELVKKNFIYKFNNTRLMINPFYCSKGVWSDIRLLQEDYKNLKLTK